MTNELTYNHSLLFSMPLPQENNRSVILERYTYKSDEGKLLKPSLDKNLHKNLDINSSRAVVKLSGTSMEEKNTPQAVRTEHCDSTTDLIEDFELDSRKMIKLYENICNTSPNTSMSDLDYSNKTRQQTIHIDSDSDCEIIDNDDDDDQMNASVSNSSDNTPQDSNIDSVTKIDENIELYVISDSDDSGDDDETAVTDLLHFEENSSDQLPDISISTINSHESQSQLIIKQINETMKQLLKPKSSILENTTVSNSFINSDSGISVNDSEAPISTASPDNRKSEFYSYLKINTNPLAQKAETVAQNRRSNRVKKRHSRNRDTNNDHEMSPAFNETSEKSNAHLQNTKTSENETRKKYLKYAKKRIIFPPPPAHVCDIIPFETTIKQYFQEESIDYNKKSTINNPPPNNKKSQFTTANGLKRKYKTNNEFLIKKKKQKVGQDHQKQETGQINKKKIHKKIINGDPLNGGKTNKQKLYIKRPYSKDKLNKPKFYIKRTYTKRKNQNCHTNIGTTSVEEKIANQNLVTEPEIEGTEEEVLKRNVCDVTKHHTNCFEATLNSHDEIKTKNHLKTCFDNNTNINGLNGLKTCDILSPNRSDTINKDCNNKLFDDITTRTSCNSDCSESDEELDDLTNERHSPVCLGFTPDDNSQRICKNMQDAVTSVANSPVIRDRVDISEPEIITISEDDENAASVQQIPIETIDTATIQMDHPKQIPFDPNVRGKSFLRSLMERKRKSSLLYPDKVTEFDISDSESTVSKTSSSCAMKKAQTHRIDINRNDGPIFSAYYMNGLVTIVQEQLVSFWKQTALGNILGVQNMWVPAGSVNRIVLDRGCVNKRSPEMILGVDQSVAYIELWTKEHKYVFREASVCDIFATIYYHSGNGPPDKKVLQLENIKGYGNDVQYAVTKNSREIIVSWYDTFNKLPNEPIQTLIRCYQLAPDFQSVDSVKVIAPVPHYISWLHNVQDSDSLLMGSGHDKISVWNIKEGGHLLKTLDLTDNTIPPAEDSKTICLYGQCETGFLFLIQQVNIGVLRLVAVNGRTYDWKQLYSYTVPENYKKLLGVIVESGILMTCYTNGFLCWNMHSGEILAEIDTNSDNIVIPSNKYLISILDYKVTVEHIMSYILTHEW